MIPQVGPPAKRDVQDRHEEGHPCAGLDQRREEPPADPPRADVVEQQADRHALATASSGQPLHELLAHGVAAEDVRRDVDDSSGPRR